MRGKAKWIAVIALIGVAWVLPAVSQMHFEAEEAFDRQDNRGRHGGNRTVAHGRGEYDWIIDESDVFGVEVENIILFDAAKLADGTFDGRIFYRQKFLDNDRLILMTVSCLEVYDNGTRIKIGGPVEVASDPIFDGLFGWFQATEGDRWNPAVSTVVGFGDELENEEFCASPALPNFGPWDVDGNLVVKERRGDGDDDDDDD